MTEHSFPPEAYREAHRPVRLPGRSPDRVSTAPATGATCAMCGVSTKQGEMEVEIEYGPGEGSNPQMFHLHPRCFFILERGRWSLD